MGRRCVVPGCMTGYDSNKEKVSLFTVPYDRIYEWNKIIGRPDRNLSPRDCVCEKHFRPEFIIKVIIKEGKDKVETVMPRQVPKLSPDAIPTIFPDCICTFKKRKSRKRRIMEKDETPIKEEGEESQGKNEGEMVCNCKTKNKETEIPIKEEGDSAFEEDFTQQYSMFDSLWNKKFGPLLPSDSWGIHHITSDNNIRLIIFSKIICVYDNTVLSKKVVLNETGEVRCYVFNNLIKTDSFIDIKNVSCLAELEKLIRNFDKVPICHGVRPNFEIPENFNGTDVFKESSLNTWRHKNCSYFLTTNPNVLYSESCHVCQEGLCREVNNCLKANSKSKSLIHVRGHIKSLST